MELAEDEGLEVQRRQIHIDEVAQGKFSEIGACGTAVVGS
jgi:branched-subunit amino acid aminotransferase/4-amino-4-deoxychorismate lyase